MPLTQASTFRTLTALAAFSAVFTSSARAGLPDSAFRIAPRTCPRGSATASFSGSPAVKGTYLDEPLMMLVGSTKYYYHANDLYSVAALTSSSGTVVERYKYDPYGKVTVLDASGTAKSDPNNSEFGNPFTYTGQRLDKETGLMYYKNRYYSTGLGRFVSRDPIESVNLYQYADSIPTKQTDIYGEDGDEPNYTCYYPRKRCGVKKLKLEFVSWQLNVPGFTFKVVAEYRTDFPYDPQCCRYIQQIKGLVTRKPKDGKEVKVPGGEGGSPFDDKWHVDSFPYKGDDDKDPQGGPYQDKDSASDRFESVDIPGWFKEPLPEGTRVTWNVTFKGQIIDICNGNEVVATDELTTSMIGKVNKGEKPWKDWKVSPEGPGGPPSKGKK